MRCPRRTKKSEYQNYLQWLLYGINGGTFDALPSAFYS